MNSEICAIVENHYGITVKAKQLAGEVDLNFWIEDSRGQQFIFKLCLGSDNDEVLQFQSQALKYLKAQKYSVCVPEVVPTLEGSEIFLIEFAPGKIYQARLMTFVPGRLFAKTSPHSSNLLVHLGSCLGELNCKLLGFDSSTFIPQRDLKWDLRQGLWIADHLDEIESKENRKIVESFLSLYKSTVVPSLSQLRMSVIHGDANDYNILVQDSVRAGGQRISGLIDFGDLLYTHTINELAISLAYIMMNKPDPLAAGVLVIAGYHEVSALSELEVGVLFSLIGLRLCVSVVNSAQQKKLKPNEAYLTISEDAAWALLKKLSEIDPQFAQARFRSACGFSPSSHAAQLQEWLIQNPERIGNVLDKDLSTLKKRVFDLSPGSLEMGVQVLEPRVMENGEIGIGRYNEARLVYQGDCYRVEGNDGGEARTIHLGIDLFLPVGERIYAPLAGTVHSFQNNKSLGDYGPTLILKHEIPENNLTFYSLYGHLSLESLEGLFEGKFISKGTEIGKIGSTLVNGGWPPHVHFQLMTDVFAKKGEFPGVARPSERSFWIGLCPDPSVLLKLDPQLSQDQSMSPKEVLQRRAKVIGKSLSISYHEPLKIVRGSMQYVYDETGRRFIDATNNVSHVGHCHPRVVKAGQEQMAVLNTNTRYLHDHLVHYAERLCATLPSALSVCYFVCSGSEANELALRMARTHTRKKAMVVVEGGYHGNTNGLIEISPYKFDGPAGPGAPSFVHQVPMPDTYRGIFKKDDPDAGRKYAQGVDNVIQAAMEAGNPIAGCICESLLSCGGQLVLPDNYLKEVYQSVRNVGGVCIADEVQVGFGRVGSHFWGFETQGVVPDIVTLGKPMGNGHPLAAVVTTPEIAQSFHNGMEYFNTFGGNPVSCAIGLAVLDVIYDEGLQAHALDVGNYLMGELNLLRDKYSIIGEVRGLGLFIGLDLVLNRDTLQPAPDQASYIVNRMRNRGVLLSTDGPYHNVIKFKPPLVFTRGDADFIVENFKVILAEDAARSSF